MIGRSTLYKGIKMRSRLEADFAREMDRRRMHWAYEPQCFADATGQYLPDFGIYGEEGMPPTRYIELKPPTFTDADSMRARMEIVWSTDPTAALHLILWEWGTSRPVATWFSFGSPCGWTHWTPATGIVTVA